MIRDTKKTDSWIIVSDVHLGGFCDAVNQMLEAEFYGVLKYARECGSGLIINGDLFDYYMEYSGKVPEYVDRVTNQLQQYSNSTGFQPIYITGNHDNWDYGFLSSRDCDVMHEELRFNFGNLRALIAHGDGLTDPTLGLPRPPMHRILRNHTFVRIFKLLTTMKTGNAIMKWFSRLNRKLESGNDATVYRIDNWAKNLLLRDEIDVVITAHHHKSTCIKFSNKLYLNSGCFYLDRTAIRYTNNRFELVKWNNQAQTFIPYKSGNSDT